MRKRDLALLSIVLLAACGGGGGGTSGPTGIGENYYPVATGARWAYQVTSTAAAAPYVDDMEITGQRLVSGRNAWVFYESDAAGDGAPAESYYAKDTRAFTFLGMSTASAAGWMVAALAPYDLMRFDGTFSASPLLDSTGIDIGADLDGDGVHERLDAHMTGAVEGFENLAHAIGSFTGTARVRYDVTGTLHLSSGPSWPLTMTIREWRAPALGTLRQISDLALASVQSSTTVDVRGLLVDGVGAGILPPRDLRANLAPADSDSTRPGRPALASDGAQHLLVSNRQTTTGRQWIAQFVGADGQPQGSIIELSPSVSDLGGSPAVAWDGSNFLVATSTSTYGLRAQRVSAAGVLLDAFPGTAIAADGFNVALASAPGGNSLAVYRRSALPGQLLGSLLFAGGVSGTEFVIASGSVADFALPALAFNGSNFLVVWEAGPGASNPAATDLYAMRVSTLGARLHLSPFAVSTAAEAQWYPQVACDGTNCLVAWADRRNYPGASYSYSPGPGDMYGTFVAVDGSVLNGDPASGGIPIATGITANAGYPGLAYTGSDYLLAWSRGAYVSVPGGPTGIYAARIDTAGGVTPAAPGLEVSGPPPAATRLYYPTLAAVPSGVLAVWLKNVETVGASKSMAGTVIWPYLSR